MGGVYEGWRIHLLLTLCACFDFNILMTRMSRMGGMMESNREVEFTQVIISTKDYINNLNRVCYSPSHCYTMILLCTLTFFCALLWLLFNNTIHLLHFDSCVGENGVVGTP